jgi:hypothetical protein
MRRVLVSWVGASDLKAMGSGTRGPHGPVADALVAMRFDEPHLLCNYPIKDARAEVKWVRERTDAAITQHAASAPRRY